MAVSIKSAREIELMRESGRILAMVHDELGKAIVPGISTKEIDILGSQNDIKPTIIDLLGFENSFSSMGNSLFDESSKNRFVYTFGGNQIGLIKDDCHIMFNYKDVTSTSCKDDLKFKLEEELKAIDSFESYLLDKNKWSNVK